jgi:signal transduction histidine kinase
MQELLDDLLDYNRTSLSIGLSIKKAPSDLVAACQEEIELRCASHPHHPIEFEATGVTEGLWDASRIKQALGNLISNAAKYGAPQGTIRVSLRADEAQAHLSVKNEGPTIARETISALFEPLRRMPNCKDDDRVNLGLGLFIVREVARAHGGSVTVDSSNGVTNFSLHLPRA